MKEVNEQIYTNTFSSYYSFNSNLRVLIASYARVWCEYYLFRPLIWVSWVEPPCTTLKTAPWESISQFIFHLNSHTSLRISSTDSKNHLVQDDQRHHSKVPLDSLHLNVILSTFKLSNQNRLVQHNKQHQMKVLLSSFHLNGQALGFHPQTQKLELPRTA